MEVAPGHEARLLEDRREVLARRPGEARGLEDHELAGLQHAGERVGGGLQRPEVGLAIGGQRRRHADQHRVAARERLGVRRAPRCVRSPPAGAPT